MIDQLTFLGHPKSCRLSNDTVDLVVPTGIGPRILRYGFTGAENMLGEYPDLHTATTLGEWKPWGGHRLWVAPEEMPQSYAPDNSSVQCELRGEQAIHLRQPTD